ncbi:MAG: hypothetical protein JNJ49_15890 [Bdellovibrionaceae bacterium]|nr:hypothetical protein [Pseudobdellovibrionaceae bacterium]
MKSVLEGFLGTYTSRYSDLRGYWLHGQLPFDTFEYHFDLMATPPNDDTPEAAARRLAVRRFKEQLAKSGFEVAVVRSADLRIHMGMEAIEGWQGDHRSVGHMVDFTATAVMDTDRRYERTRTVFVAPHNAEKERRRLPADWGT